MDIVSAILIIIGLILFETVSSIDNAVINAQVLATMSDKAKRWFLTWGLFIAVFAMRGLLPFAIIWAVNPGLGPIGAVTAAFSADPAVQDSVERSAPVLLAGGGTFLLFLFFHWLFLEPKHYGLRGEKRIEKYGVWFYAVVSILLAAITWFALKIDPMMAFSAVMGSTAFFITHGFKENAEKAEAELLHDTGRSDMSKILYLEAIDATFSIDGVLGAFAFTLSVPLILIGNGVGAYVVREATIRGINTIKKYMYLKNGAMYSVFFLGGIMVADSFGLHIPHWFTPIITIVIIAYFFWKSKAAWDKDPEGVAKITGAIIDKPKTSKAVADATPKAAVPAKKKSSRAKASGSKKK
jgi:hypothetical protein